MLVPDYGFPILENVEFDEKQFEKFSIILFDLGQNTQDTILLALLKFVQFKDFTTALKKRNEVFKVPTLNKFIINAKLTPLSKILTFFI
jgi:hypothetical protein